MDNGNNVSLNEIGILGSAAKVSQSNFITTYPVDQKPSTIWWPMRQAEAWELCESQPDLGEESDDDGWICCHGLPVATDRRI
ncbi:hypothetical protein [Rhizobium leguminosarum]|uniref:hypothetical protein n=1 Tax=Rhizobium leguminosarum TaxID=384 RepID=UPI0021B12F13|nr:hypothetical protein [Rhizobium leguminosarum]